jgi:hypothetical protein
VWNARERDTHNFGVVVDNDGGEAQQGYSERNGKQKWQTGTDGGFAFLRRSGFRRSVRRGLFLSGSFFIFLLDQFFPDQLN